MPSRYHSIAPFACLALWALCLFLLMGCHHKPAPHTYGATASPALLVPAWWVDNSDITGCASDNNNCQSATCGAAGVGPCSTYAEIVSRWGTASPVIAQTSKITFLSDDTEAPIDMTPTVTTAGKFIVTGTLTVAGSGTVGTVTARNRSTPQLLTANLGQAVSAFVGFIFSDTTRNSYAWLDSASSGNVATLTQPFSLNTDCASTPTYQDTVTLGDSYQILRPSKVPIRTFNPSLPTVYFLGQNYACVEHLWVPDPSGTPALSAFNLNMSAIAAEARFDPNTYFRDEKSSQEPSYDYNVFWNGAIQANVSSQNAPGIIGGDIYSSESQGGNVASNGGFILDGGVITHQFVLMGNGSGALGDVYVKSHLEILKSNIQLQLNVGPAAIWGPGLLQVGPGASLVLEGGITATATILQTGGLFFGNVSNISTGCAYDTTGDPVVTHCGRTLTPAHIDGTVASGGFGGSAVDPFLMSSITAER